MQRALAIAAAAAAVFQISNASAQEATPAAETPTAEAAAKPTPAAAPAASADLHEDPQKRTYYIGFRYRDVVVPKFMIDIFADGGATVNVPMFGPELTMRKNRWEIDLAVMYADYSMKPFLFKGKSDGEDSFEIVGSSMKALYFTADLLYDIPIDDAGHFSFLVGGGLGFAPIFGDLNRNQAFPHDPSHVSTSDVNQWTKCKSAGHPGTVSKANGAAFCDDANAHYGNYTEPSWANGGSKPFLFPWVSIPQISLRYKPVKQLQMRGDLGFSITGFFFGLNAAYGL